MIISHERRFIFFPDPLGASADICDALAPWADDDRMATFDGPAADMTPVEAEWHFDSSGLAFRSYLRIAVVENPYARVCRLFDRIAREDRFWSLRQSTGLPPPDFAGWLGSIRPHGQGAAGRRGPRWRQFGAWSAKYWLGGLINHPVRLEHLEDDLTPALAQLGIAPSLGDQSGLVLRGWQDRFDQRAVAVVKQKYAWDLAQFAYPSPRYIAA